MSEVIRAAAKKWFYESFDCDLLEKMQKAGLIAQAEGFSISVMAELELEMESAFQSQLAALREELAKRGRRIIEIADQRNEAEQRLADAERRNETITDLLRQVSEDGEFFPIRQRYWVRIHAALTKPEEAKS